MNEREKMQARFSKNNNFGGTLRTERNTFTLALFFSTIMQQSHL